MSLFVKVTDLFVQHVVKVTDLFVKHARNFNKKGHVLYVLCQKNTLLHTNMTK